MSEQKQTAPDIRIGTLVSAGMKSPAYIRQILPHGFESFSITFWQTTVGIDWPKLADETRRALDGSGAVISSLGVFGNPLETQPKDLETLIHGKDATIYWDRVRKYGVRTSVHEDIARKSGSQGAKPFAYHRTPGFGDSNWTAIISELRMAGFKGAIDIEGWHDPVMKKELEMTGQVAALRYLKQCRGDFIPNPVV